MREITSSLIAEITAANTTQPWWSTPTQGRFATGSNTSPGQTGHAPPSEGHEDAPPSYEEAIGQDPPPINGYRGSYQPPPVPEGAPRFSDEKKR
jgi:hypothetical protein